MRGKPLSVGIEEVAAGITPAHAGKTEVHSILPQLIRDHPRACGENVDSDMGEIYEWGSPPRVRGKHAPREAFRQQTRITPACAGKTGSPASPLCPSPDHPPRVRGKLSKGKGKGATYRDHPRVCGENLG